jgi:hypothetical protein
VGENEEKRQAGQAEATVIEQLQGSLPLVEGAAQLCGRLRAGLGDRHGPRSHGEDVGAMHRAIRRVLVRLWRGRRGFASSMAAR